MRISTQTLVDQTLFRLQKRLGSFEKAQSRLATGKNFTSSSEDVAGMNASLALRSERRAVEQAQRNAEDGKTRINLADTKIQQMLTTLRRARDLTIRGSSTLQPSERDAISQELNSIREEMVELANGGYLGQGLFSGHSANSAVTDVAGTWTYTGDNGALLRRVTDNEAVTVNVRGEEIFGFADGEAVFDVIEQIITDVNTGDPVAVSAGLDALDRSARRLEGGLARLGAVGNRIEVAMGRNLQIDETLQLQLSSIEDVDLAEAVMEITTQEVALQATLGAIARAVQPTLMNYLR
ncbi:MAG: hypothetical protein GXP35_08435 [Actinobacteria bacterium]|nr:hypothetical protein [Actinomycetota bacterium]